MIRKFWVIKYADGKFHGGSASYNPVFLMNEIKLYGNKSIPARIIKDLKKQGHQVHDKPFPAALGIAGY